MVTTEADIHEAGRAYPGRFFPDEWVLIYAASPGSKTCSTSSNAEGRIWRYRIVVATYAQPTP